MPIEGDVTREKTMCKDKVARNYLAGNGVPDATPERRMSARPRASLHQSSSLQKILSATFAWTAIDHTVRIHIYTTSRLYTAQHERDSSGTTKILEKVWGDSQPVRGRGAKGNTRFYIFFFKREQRHSSRLRSKLYKPQHCPKYWSQNERSALHFIPLS